ncbi:MAG: hypothetical protein IT254_12880, partial [Chitinophagaceae bacterium]|nr:hypothetical protein [Chitinophagaceae bacterium]
MQRLACFSIYVWLSACFYHSTAQDNNYMRTWNAKSPFFASAGNYTQIPVSDALQVTNYVDGLGRPLQQVIKEGSLNTHSQDSRDWVIPFVYDGFGRESQKYLGYPSVQSSADGELKQDPIQEQTDFLNTKYSENGFTYSSFEFESSPFGRITKTIAPGQSWVGSSRGVTVGYFLGTADDHVVHFITLPPNDNLAFSDIIYSGEYQPGMLNKKITTDEQGKQVIEFQTLDGLTVLKKVQHTSNNDDGNGTDHSGWLCTYYIYDDFGRLICVIQPRGVELLQSLGWDISQQPLIYDEQCFRYIYDARNRLVQKKVPGADPVYMVYDVRDRLVLSQDGKQRLKSQWLYTKYDDLNRVIQTGLYQSPMTRYDHELAGWDETVYPANTGNNELVLTKTFYDNYKWLANEGFSMSEQYYNNSWDYLFLTDQAQWPYPLINDHQNIVCTGLVTGTGVRSEATGNLIFTVNRFDQKSRIIQAKTFGNALNGKDVFTTQYSWNGKILFTVHNQKTEPGGEITVLKKFSYDALDRLIKSEQKIAKEDIKSGQLPEDFTPVSQIEYNEMGQVETKTIPDLDGSQAIGSLETEHFDYNIRGWSLGMNREYFNASPGSEQDHYFGYELGYDKTGSDVTDNVFTASQYNGNITGMAWKSKNKEISRQYDFSYDPLNRLTNAQYSQHDPYCTNSLVPNFNVSDLTYDANGNILTMKQWGLTNGTNIVVDDLHYQYTKNAISNISNQLSAVNDNAANAVNLGDFRDNSSTNDNEYQYDANGNLIIDLNKRIQLIKYNYLNLPVRIEFSNQNSGIIEYKYDAAGTKQQKVVTETEGTATYRTTTYYLGELVYEKREGYPDADGTTKLQFISNEEGRTTYDAVHQELHYEYMMKDHLGNIRMLLRGDPSDPVSYSSCDFENSSQPVNVRDYLKADYELYPTPSAFNYSQGTNETCQMLKNFE